MADQSNPVRVGIAGLGRSGWDIHARTLEGLTDRFRVVAVTDADPIRRKEAAEKFGCRTYDQFEALAADEEVELLVVATPSYLHAPHAVAALRAGKHVLSEKPMAAHLRGAEEMLAAAKESGRILTVFQNRRYAQDFVQVKKVIDSGRLGRIVQIKISHNGFGRRWDWQTLKKYGGGSLNNTGPHVFDVALELFGGGPDDMPEVFADLQRTLTSGDADDHVKVLLKKAGRPTIDIEISSACPYPGGDAWNVMGTAGGLRGNANALEWKWVDFAKFPPRPVQDAPQAAGREYNFEQLTFEEDRWEVDPALPSGETMYYQDLYATLREGKPLAIDPRSVRRQIAVLEECRRQSPV